MTESPESAPVNASPSLPVTVIVSRRPKPGREAELVAGAEEISAAAANFEGHLGRAIYPPQAPDRDELVLVFSFDTAEHLAVWENSDERRQWLERARPLVASARYGHELTGFESIFSPSVGVTKSPPPRWKTGTVIALALFPLSLLLNYLVMPFVPSTGTWATDVFVRVVISVAIIVPYMVYFAMPRLTKLLRNWLHPAAS